MVAIPGLPALSADVIFETVALAVADLLLPNQTQQQWGLFLNGAPVVVSDNVLSFEFKEDRRISNYPVEAGGFESYNKVAVPYDVRLRFSTGGSIADRQAMQDSIDAIMDSLDSFDAVTPTKTYLGINPVHQSLRQTARDGVGLLVIDIFCEQVRVTATAQFSNTSTNPITGASTSSGTSTGSGTITIRPITDPQSPSASPQVAGGTVQAVAPTPAQQSAVDGVLAQSSLPF